MMINDVPQFFWEEIQGRMQQEFMRAATGVAWYQKETGRTASAIEKLVPKYLPSIPTHPDSSQPLQCAAGLLWLTQNGKSGGNGLKVQLP